MQLQQLVEALQTGRLPRRAVAITFDDGYADNLYNAKPLLERYDSPATVFVASGYVDQNREFWWDELERLLLEPGTLPRTLKLDVGGNVCEWELGEASEHNRKAADRTRHWNAFHEDNPTARHYMYRTLCRKLRPLDTDARQRVLDEIRMQGTNLQEARLTHRPLTSEEVGCLSKDGLVDVGAHTVTHPVLSAVGACAQWHEITQSKRALEEILEHPVTTFAYPYGSRSDYTAETVASVKRAGFLGACSNFFGSVRHFSEHFELPRVVVRNWDGDMLARLLRRWFRE
jgi:peptidoglycan/xylan/chitin deacetylase (PgdA/CDA1 family)